MLGMMMLSLKTVLFCHVESSTSPSPSVLQCHQSSAQHSPDRKGGALMRQVQPGSSSAHVASVSFCGKEPDCRIGEHKWTETAC